MGKLGLTSYFILIITFLSCSKKPKTYFNIPLLIGKNIDETRKILNLKTQKDPSDTSITHWDDYYEVEGRILMINYNPKTRKIGEISLIYPKGYSSKNEILKAGNLQENTQSYTCEVSTDIWALSPFTSYNGIRINAIN